MIRRTPSLYFPRGVFVETAVNPVHIQNRLTVAGFILALLIFVLSGVIALVNLETQAQLPAKVFEKSFNELGPVHLTCNIHKEMSAWVLVLQNPYFTAPDPKTGEFTITGVPPGAYTVRIWGEKLEEEDAAKKFPITVGEHSEPLNVAAR